MLTKYLRSLMVAALLLPSLGHASPVTAGPGMNLPAPEAYQMMSQGELTVIDIRRPEEWRQTGIAKDAIRINMLHPEGAAGFLGEVLRTVDGNRDAPIGLICRTGNRTTQVQRFLVAQGFTQVYNIREGMAGSGSGPGWLRRGLPVDPCRNC